MAFESASMKRRSLRVGFIIDTSGVWLGGFNYLRNLILAASRLSEQGIHPVLVVPPDDRIASTFGPLVEVQYFDGFGAPGRWSGVSTLTRIIGGGKHLRHLVESARLDAISHSGVIAKGIGVPVINWIPDFQHRKLKSYSTWFQRIRRDMHFRLLIRASDRLILSSEASAADCRILYPHATDKIRVLRFRSGLFIGKTTLGDDSFNVETQEDRPYIHLPNQAWAHKDHETAFRACMLLKDRGLPVRLVCTGPFEDHRNPQHVQRLKSLLESSRAGDIISHRGMVEYSEMLKIMSGAAALLNPSRFEGWSTSVEEARVFGKRMILSDIPVHREQNPPDTLFFQPGNVEELAGAMQKVFSEPSSLRSVATLLDTAEKRFNLFAQDYGRIVMDVTTGV